MTEVMAEVFGARFFPHSAFFPGPVFRKKSPRSIRRLLFWLQPMRTGPKKFNISSPARFYGFIPAGTSSGLKSLAL